MVIEFGNTTTSIEAWELGTTTIALGVSIKQGSRKEATIQFRRDIGTGEEMAMLIRFKQSYIRNAANDSVASFEYWTGFRSTIAVYRSIVWFDPGLKLLNATPSPISSSAYKGFFRALWSQEHVSSLGLNLTLDLSTPKGFQAFTTEMNHTVIEGKTGEIASLELKLTGLYPSSFQVTIEAEMATDDTKLQTVTLEQDMVLTVKIDFVVPSSRGTDKIVLTSNVAGASITEIEIHAVPDGVSPWLIFLAALLALNGLLLGAAAILASFKPGTLTRWWTKIRAKLHVGSVDQDDAVVATAVVPEAESVAQTEPDAPMKDLGTLLIQSNALDHNEIRVVVYLHEKGQNTQQTIADSLAISKATVSRTVGKLESKGLVTRTQVGMSNRIAVVEESLSALLSSEPST